MRKSSLFLVAGACLATLTLTMGSALADPNPGQPPQRPLQGTGSDTSQDVMNAYANGTTLTTPAFCGVGRTGPPCSTGTLTIASWDAVPQPSNITTKPGCTIARPNGSGAGLNALQGIGFQAGCVDFARSSVNDGRAGLTYVPFALDAVTYATLSQSNVPKNLPLTTLQTIFQANTTDPNGCIFKPRVPQVNSGTKKFWQSLVAPAGFGTCVDQTTIEEHDGSIVGTDPDVIAPYGVGPWVTQSTNKTITDRRGLAILRGIDSKSPFVYQGFAGTRELFNVVRTADITDPVLGPQIKSAFGKKTGTPPGQICSNPQVLGPFGLQEDPNCGNGIP